MADLNILREPTATPPNNVIPIRPTENEDAIKLLNYWLEIAKSGKPITGLHIFGFLRGRQGRTMRCSKFEDGEITYGEEQKPPEC